MAWSSIVTMHPAWSADSRSGKASVRMVFTCSIRAEDKRREIREGVICPESAMRAEKSKSWVRITRPVSFAVEIMRVSAAHHAQSAGDVSPCVGRYAYLRAIS